MTFREGGQFEGGRVRKSAGGRGGIAVGGGAVGLIIVFLIAQFTGVDVSGLLQGGGSSQSQDLGEIGDCTAEQANTDPECRLSATLQALDAFWVPEASRIGVSGFEIPGAESFTGSVGTGCGNATSAVGPFYCPPDQGIYLDLDFFDVLRSRFGAS
ncbi:MAG: neutral zinc metallopeptidase, partial [Actinomycetales bacterium]|nr:neutral zinc metallopeptidase [Actinomycetales bacterium]